MEEFDNNDHKLDRIEKILRDSFHPTGNELGKYILYKNGIEDDKSILKLIPRIELHLRKCTECKNLFLELNSEYSDLDNFLSEFQQAKKENKSEPLIIPGKTNVKYFKYSGLVLAVVCLLYFGMFSVSRVVTPASLKYAEIENVSDFYETRGRVTTDFQESLKSFENGDYESSVNWLQKDIADNSTDETVFYSHYLLGLAYLESAHHDILGMFPSYSKNKVNSGIAALNKALSLNNSGKFNSINLDIYFFLAKADLMLNNITDARENLHKVVNEKGSKMSEAKKILAGLD